MKASSKALTGLLALLLASCAAPKRLDLPDRPVDSAEPAPGSAATPAEAAPVKKDPQTRFDEALAALKAKNLKAAREGFASLAADHPELGGPLTNLGILDTRTEAQRKGATGWFTRAVAVNPQNPVALNWLGILYREAGQYPRAEQYYLQALAITPKDPAVILNLAMLYDVHMKRPADALARYREYQTLTGNRELKVTAWIKAIEAAQAPATPAEPAAAATTGAGKS